MPTLFPAAQDTFPTIDDGMVERTPNLVNAVNNLGDAMEAVQSRLLDIPDTPFHVTVTLTSAAGATPVEIVAAADVPAGKKIYLQGFIAKVNGGTLWGTVSTVKIQDTNGTPVDFVTFAVAALGANAVLIPGTSNVTLENAFATGSGGTAAKGLQVVADVNGTGSDLKLTVWGIIR